MNNISHTEKIDPSVPEGEENNSLNTEEGSHEKEIRSVIEDTSSSVSTIMIIDELELENMIDTTIKHLLIKNDSIKKQLVTILPNFFNEFTEYYYDKKRKEITSIMLEEEQLHLLYKELATALVNDKYLKEEEKIIEEKKIRKEKTTRMQIKIEDLEYIICHYQKTLFQINHHTHDMEEKIKKIIDEGYSSYLQANVEAYKKEQEEIEKEKIKLIEEIQMYNCTLKLISHIKKEEIKKEMWNIIDQYLYSFFPYHLHESQIKTKGEQKKKTLLQKITWLFHMKEKYEEY